MDFTFFAFRTFEIKPINFNKYNYEKFNVVRYNICRLAKIINNWKKNKIAHYFVLDFTDVGNPSEAYV